MTASIALLRAASVTGGSQSPSAQMASIDGVDGSDLTQVLISFAGRGKARNANRSAQRDVAAHVRKFLAVNPSPLVARIYWLMCSAFKSTSLPASELYMKRSASFAPNRLVRKMR